MVNAKVLLCFVVFAASAAHSKLASEIVQVKELPATSGLYFQSTSNMQFVQNIWHFVIEMDHGSVFMELKTLYDDVFELLEYLKDQAEFKNCPNAKIVTAEINSNIVRHIRELTRVHNMLDDKVPKAGDYERPEPVKLKTHRRHKRGLLNFVGRVDKFLFGTMDSDDAHLLHQLANNSNSLNSQVKQLDDELIAIAKYIDHKAQVDAQKYSNICLYVTSKLNLICEQVAEIEALYNKLDRAIDSAKLNHLNSMVISPDRLLREMKNVSGHLAGLSWPVPLTHDSMHVLIDTIINVHVFVTEERKLLFILEVPLVNSQVYNLFHTIPLPFCDAHSKCAIVLPDSKYLGVSVDRRTYLRLDDTKTCKMAGKLLLCYRPQIIYETNQAKLCDIRIFMKSEREIDFEHDCDVRVGRFEDELFYATSDFNNWLYVLQNDVDLNFECTNSPTIPDGNAILPIVLKAGVGVIRATGHDSCKLTTKKSTLSVHELYSNLNSVIEMPINTMFNISAALHDIDKLQLNTMKTNNDLEHTNLHEMTDRLYELRRRIGNNTVFSGSDVTDEVESNWLANWFAGVGIDFHIVKMVFVWVVLTFVALACFKIYQTCCPGTCSALCSLCRRRRHDPTVVRRDDRDMYYQHTMPKRSKSKHMAIESNYDPDDDLEMHRLN
ncbi:fusion protein [Peridroma alphabaculovirus]|uniref:Fusion protein n=1 Tax=Peridroma alphabaculovirus TaxID=1346829 RepID=A0A068LRA4_9ABAC|nr:fusion protein [Peridroma alphabaculovirus]AIE47740.1 fusion protein [Peridroma alphabaculovirus]